MMPASHKALLIAAAAGYLAGMLFVAFVFYPPHADWDREFQWGDAATWCAAAGTIAAIYYAVSGGRRTLEHSRSLFEAEREERQSNARARAAVIAAGFQDELASAIVKCQELELMLAEPKFEGWLNNIFEYASALHTPFFDAHFLQEVFNVENGAQFANTSIKLSRLKKYAVTSWPKVSTWNAAARQFSRVELISKLEMARVCMENAYGISRALSREPLDYSIDELYMAAAGIYNTRVCMAEEAQGGTPSDAPSGENDSSPANL